MAHEPTEGGAPLLQPGLVLGYLQPLGRPRPPSHYNRRTVLLALAVLALAAAAWCACR